MTLIEWADYMSMSPISFRRRLRKYPKKIALDRTFDPTPVVTQKRKYTREDRLLVIWKLADALGYTPKVAQVKKGECYHCDGLIRGICISSYRIKRTKYFHELCYVLWLDIKRQLIDHSEPLE